MLFDQRNEAPDVYMSYHWISIFKEVDIVIQKLDEKREAGSIIHTARVSQFQAALQAFESALWVLICPPSLADYKKQVSAKRHQLTLVSPLV
mmetsp:Transcript_24625/g.41889  ORF Transcript_24625/g.41889 Transcript_24625/m.41889 type:complete len:92 (+) Transcript_24625:855-1130(+)